MMSPYLIIFLALLIMYCLSIASRISQKALLVAAFSMLGLFMGLRCGQGTDYNMYRWLYDSAPDHLVLSDPFFSPAVHSEPLWKALMLVLKAVHIPFELFIALLSLFLLFCLYRFIQRFSPDPFLSLIIAYPNLVLVYFMSGLRQGLVIAVFLGYLTVFIERREVLKYFAVTAILLFVHSSAIVFLMTLPFCMIQDRRIICSAPLICLAAGLIPLFIPGVADILAHAPFIGYYFAGNESVGYVGISFSSLARRLFWLVLLVVLGVPFLKRCHAPYASSFSFLFKPYLFGICLYAAFIAAPSAAGRFFAPFQSLEIALVPILAYGRTSFKSLLQLVSVCVSAVLLINVLNSFVAERDYYRASWFDYPYYSVFTPKNEIARDRPPLYDLP